MNANAKESTKKQVEDSVSKWLCGSRDRDGQRVQRQKRERRQREERERATLHQTNRSLPDYEHEESE